MSPSDSVRRTGPLERALFLRTIAGAGFDALEITAYEPADDCATPRVIPGSGFFPVTVNTENAGAGEAESDPDVPCVDTSSDPDAGRWGSLWFEFTPAETAFRASISSPESVSSRTASFGSSMAIWRISFRFFSPPEKPSLTLRSRKAGSMATRSSFS